MKSEKPTLVIHAIRSDATNSSVWHSSKLFGMELVTTYVRSTSGITDGATFLERSRTRGQFADPQRVADSTAAGTHAMLRKQLQGLGVPVWERKLAAEQQGQAAPTGPDAAPLASPLRLWLITSDGGSDQMKFRRVMKLETETNGSAIVVDATCVLHSGALVFRSGLVLIDNWLQRVGAPFKYYSSLAKLMHIWRDNARQVFLSWLARFGAVEAVRHAKRMPPRCIAGR